jgi:hypothetical protein
MNPAVTIDQVFVTSSTSHGNQPWSTRLRWAGRRKQEGAQLRNSPTERHLVASRHFSDPVMIGYLIITGAAAAQWVYKKCFWLQSLMLRVRFIY